MKWPSITTLRELSPVPAGYEFQKIVDDYNRLANGREGAGRIIDLSKAAAEQLGMARKGVARVRVRYLGPAPAGR